MTIAATTLFFDWDYTLAYTQIADNSNGERLAFMFQQARLPYDLAQIEDALQQYDRDVSLGKFTPHPHPQKRRDIARFYRRLFDYLGEADNRWEVMERLYGTYAQLPTYLYEDSRPTLQLLARQGYVLGIITNHSRSARPLIERLVGDLVPAAHIVISEELGVHKPAKTIFRTAAARTRTAAPNCLLVGDNLQVDAEGAVAQGGYGWGIWLDRREGGGDQPLSPRVHRISTLSDLPGLLTEPGTR